MKRKCLRVVFFICHSVEGTVVACCFLLSHAHTFPISVALFVIWDKLE